VTAPARLQEQFFPLNFLRKPLHLLLQCAQEKENPRLPVWGICPDRHLGLAEREIIAFFALLDHVFE